MRTVSRLKGILQIKGRSSITGYLFRKRVLLGFLACVVSYNVLPLILFKTPWTHLGHPDEDFDPVRKEDEVVIIRWTKYFKGYHDSPQILNTEKCPYAFNEPIIGGKRNTSQNVFTSCRITHDRRYLRVSDALVFHSYDLMSEEVPKERSNEQLWIYMQQECPIYTKLNLQAYHNVFNWTMTYRRDSDVYFPYGYVVPEVDLKELNDATTAILSKKTHLVSWIVSSCDSHSKREYLIKELQQYIPIDVYGWCGQDCPSQDCYAHTSKSYKFYLSFENSLCKDYITEKFFYALAEYMVPVVYGGVELDDYAAIAPNHSYIDARNFKTTKELAQYLQYLNENDEAYLEYFRWKSKYKLVHSQGWCNLCQRVHEHKKAQKEQFPKKTRNYKWYGDLWKWWNYLGYDTSVEVDELMQNNIGQQSYYYKLGAPTCRSPKEFSSDITPNFEPGFINGRLYGKLGSWIRELIFGS